MCMQTKNTYNKDTLLENSLGKRTQQSCKSVMTKRNAIKRLLHLFVNMIDAHLEANPNESR